MPFAPGFKPPLKMNTAPLWFLFQKGKLLIKQEGQRCSIPLTSELDRAGFTPPQGQYIGLLDDRPCYTAELDPAVPVESPFGCRRLRSLFGSLGDEFVRIAGLAGQLLQWLRNHRYCGRCGRVMENKADERALNCPRCGLLNYPRLSPAIIVAVIRGARILLAHSHRFPAQFYSVLAGFVEPGETLEDCVRREVREEVGITVKNIRYFGSQPWPFPDSLMIAFTAEYAGDEIKIDNAEITHAEWFAADNLPAIPPRLSIARQLIDWFAGTAGD